MHYYGYRTLGFGFSVGPYWQTCIATMCCRAVILQCEELGVLTTQMPEYDEHQQVPTPAVVGQQLTAVLALLDDFAFFGTSLKVCQMFVVTRACIVSDVFKEASVRS